MMKGKFITLEAIWMVVAKPIISKIVYDRLRKEGYKVLLTREPGGIDISEQIRNIILDKNITMEARTEALLYAATKKKTTFNWKVKPALEDDYIVICDRFVDSY